MDERDVRLLDFLAPILQETIDIKVRLEALTEAMRIVGYVVDGDNMTSNMEPLLRDVARWAVSEDPKRLSVSAIECLRRLRTRPSLVRSILSGDISWSLTQLGARILDLQQVWRNSYVEDLIDPSSAAGEVAAWAYVVNWVISNHRTWLSSLPAQEELPS